MPREQRRTKRYGHEHGPKHGPKHDRRGRATQHRRIKKAEKATEVGKGKGRVGNADDLVKLLTLSLRGRKELMPQFTINSRDGLKRLFKNGKIEDAIKKCVELPGRFGIQVGLLCKMMGAHADEHIDYYLDRCHKTWKRILPNKATWSLLDDDTVKHVQSRAPATSWTDYDYLEKLYQKKKIFANFNDKERRDIWRSLREIKILIPSFQTFFADLGILTDWSQAMKRLFDISGTETIWEVMEKDFGDRPGLDRALKRMAYHVLQNLAGFNPLLLHVNNLQLRVAARRAKQLGFDNDKIQDLLAEGDVPAPSYHPAPLDFEYVKFHQRSGRKRLCAKEGDGWSFPGKNEEYTVVSFRFVEYDVFQAFFDIPPQHYTSSRRTREISVRASTESDISVSPSADNSQDSIVHVDYESHVSTPISDGTDALTTTVPRRGQSVQDWPAGECEIFEGYEKPSFDGSTYEDIDHDDGADAFENIDPNEGVDTDNYDEDPATQGVQAWESNGTTHNVANAPLMDISPIASSVYSDQSCVKTGDNSPGFRADPVTNYRGLISPFIRGEMPISSPISPPSPQLPDRRRPSKPMLLLYTYRDRKWNEQHIPHDELSQITSQVDTGQLLPMNSDTRVVSRGDESYWNSDLILVNTTSEEARANLSPLQDIIGKRFGRRRGLQNR